MKHKFSICDIDTVPSLLKLAQGASILNKLSETARIRFESVGKNEKQTFSGSLVLGDILCNRKVKHEMDHV